LWNWTRTAALVCRVYLLVAAVAQPLAADTCARYKKSGPVVVARNNQVIENLEILAGNGPGIDLNGKSGVKIRNVVIRHSSGPDIRLNGAANATISDADIVHEGGPAKGKNRSDQENNIDCYDSPNLDVLFYVALSMA
jgi:hypothetical protein